MSGRDDSTATAGGIVGRRSFLEGVTVCFGAALSGLLAPVLASAQPRSAQAQARVAAKAPLPVAEADADWHIDDMWGHRPRYAHPIPHAPPAVVPLDVSRIDPIDRNFIG